MAGRDAEFSARAVAAVALEYLPSELVAARGRLREILALVDEGIDDAIATRAELP